MDKLINPEFDWSFLESRVTAFLQTLVEEEKVQTPPTVVLMPGGRSKQYTPHIKVTMTEAGVSLESIISSVNEEIAKAVGTGSGAHAIRFEDKLYRVVKASSIPGSGHLFRVELQVAPKTSQHLVNGVVHQHYTTYYASMYPGRTMIVRAQNRFIECTVQRSKAQKSPVGPGYKRIVLELAPKRVLADDREFEEVLTFAASEVVP